MAEGLDARLAAGTPSDLTIAVSRLPQPDATDFALYVHSARASHFDVAAVFALVRQPARGPRGPRGVDPIKFERLRYRAVNAVRRLHPCAGVR